MDVLQDQRKRALTPVALAGLADRARWRIRPEGLVVGSSVVIAGQAEAGGRPQSEDRRRPRKPPGPPPGLGSEPTVRRVAEQLRGIEWREIGAEEIVVAL